MPFVSPTTTPSPTITESAASGFAPVTFASVASCLYDGFRGDFAAAADCLRDSGLSQLLSDVWRDAGQRYQHHGAAVPGALDVGVACVMSAVTLGATCRYVWPELRALENAIGEGEVAQREWARQTDSQLRRRTLADVTAMRQCQAVFDATEAEARASSPEGLAERGMTMPRRKLAEIRIAESLILHIADAPQVDFAQSDRVTGLCQLLAHGLGFKLPMATLTALNVNNERPSLMRYDDAFSLLHERLVPDWRHDEPGSPTFTVHPIDVQLLDPAETTDDLSKEALDARRLLTNPKALQRVRSRVVALFAASVREDCGVVGDWRNLAERALEISARRGFKCEDVLATMAVAAHSSITTRYAWRWTDEPVHPAGEVLLPTIPMDVAQWIAQVMILAGTPGTPDRREACPPRLAALARGDTPPSLVVGCPDWIHLVDGIRALGRDHWHASYAQVCEAGKRRPA